MSRIQLTPDVLDQLKARADLVGIISHFVPLKQVGNKFMGICPFHQDSKPSMNVTPSLGIYKCFACGAGGDVIKFVQEHENLSFIESVSFVAEKSNFILPRAEETADQKAKRESITQLADINFLAQEYFHHLLLKNENASEYFLSRGLTLDSIRRFKLGWADETWDGLIKYAMNRGVSKPSLLEAGLIVEKDNGKVYDKFRARIMFPIHNLASKTIAFGGRALDPQEKAKYMNSPETPLYKKSQVLYGLNYSRNSIAKLREVIFVEGYMDFLQLFQAGVENVVSVSGTALTQEHSNILKQYAQVAHLVFDGDEAGVKAAKRSIPILLQANFSIKVLILPPGEDPDSIVKSQGAEGFLSKLKDGLNIIDFTLEQLDITPQSSPEDRREAIHQLKELIALIPDNVLRYEYIRLASQQLNIAEQLLKSSSMEGAMAHPGPMSSAPIPLQLPFDKNELHLVKLILVNQEVRQFAIQTLDIQILQSEELLSLCDYAFILEEQGDFENLIKLHQSLPPKFKGLLEQLDLENFSHQFNFSHDYLQTLLNVEFAHINRAYSSLISKTDKGNEEYHQLQLLQVARSAMSELVELVQSSSIEISEIIRQYEKIKAPIVEALNQNNQN